jgi:DNA-binding protein HU-beta
VTARPGIDRFVTLSTQQEEQDMANIDLAARLADEHGITKADARKFIDTLLAVVVEAAVQGEDVSFPGFGKFKVKDTPEREGRNPATGETITIKAAKTHLCACEDGEG